MTTTPQGYVQRRLQGKSVGKSNYSKSTRLIVLILEPQFPPISPLGSVVERITSNDKVISSILIVGKLGHSFCRLFFFPRETDDIVSFLLLAIPVITSTTYTFLGLKLSPHRAVRT
jgi:hypothetical protein